MIIDRRVTHYTIGVSASLMQALHSLDARKIPVLFLQDDSGRIVGSFTDGDFRRFILREGTVDAGVLAAANRQFFWLPEDAGHHQIAERLTNKYRLIPLLDSRHHLTGVARKRDLDVSIAGFAISEESPVFIVAEIGNNHNGSLERAMELVEAAIAAGADCVKFQMRDLETLYNNQGNANDAAEDLGSQYILDLLARYQLSYGEFEKIFQYCQDKGIIPLCTPFDIASAQRLLELGVAGFKIASADLTNHELLSYVAATGKPMLVSTGMSTEEEIIDAAKLLQAFGADYVLLHCNSTYPAPFKDINLQYMRKLAMIGECLVGYSGHERGISVSIAAVALGARVVERHITLDRSLEGNDHKVSLLPDEFRAMVTGIRQVEESLGSSAYRQMSQGELMNRENLGKSIVALVDIEEGTIISDSMLGIRSPGKGLPPYKIRDLVGKRTVRSLKKGDFFYGSDIDGARIQARDYNFVNPFGVPVRYHDAAVLASESNLDFLEFHLSYKDLELPLDDFSLGSQKLGFVLHAPELFAGDHVLDLCSRDEDYRRRSIEEMHRVIHIARDLRRYYPATTRPLIITNVGGFTRNGFIEDPVLKSELYEILSDSLGQLAFEDVEIIPQTMPPFPWHFGGQQYHNLFVSAEEIVDFCRTRSLRICLDVSHSALACNYFGWDLKRFLEMTAPLAAHYHIADAKGTDGEGLQIGEGSLDFAMVFEVMRRLSPGASWIPEIWQGHKNRGEGFWLALNRLEGFQRVKEGKE